MLRTRERAGCEKSFWLIVLGHCCLFCGALISINFSLVSMYKIVIEFIGYNNLSSVLSLYCIIVLNLYVNIITCEENITHRLTFVFDGSTHTSQASARWQLDGAQFYSVSS